MVQGLVQTLLARLPLAYCMSIQPNASLTKIGLAAPVATTVGIVLNVGFFIYLKAKKTVKNSREAILPYLKKINFRKKSASRKKYGFLQC